MGQITMTQALNLAIDEAMAEDDGVFCLGEDVSAKQGGGVFKVTSGLTEKYGEHRIRATPISETAIIGAAVGAALAGQRPIAEIMLMNFVGVCMDQIVNHAAKLRFMSGVRRRARSLSAPPPGWVWALAVSTPTCSKHGSRMSPGCMSSPRRTPQTHAG